MKKILTATFFAVALVSSITTMAQAAQEDKSKRPSPPATFKTTLSGANITINYSQPSVKGRTIGKEIAPYGQVWRTGANEATTFEVNKDVKIEGKDLKAGKYGLFTIPGENEWVIIFNNEPNQWGAFKYDASKDVLRVTVKPTKAPSFTEQMTFTNRNGKVALLWGNTEVDFSVK
ncbi:MAG: DUF2911 domain-containing protein [Flavisolibacter sp.]|nr:DUF2911 domain-containing protein [Flavisolibacter sp.]